MKQVQQQMILGSILLVTELSLRNCRQAVIAAFRKQELPFV
jgi:hypothetical protein